MVVLRDACPLKRKATPVNDEARLERFDVESVADFRLARLLVVLDEVASKGLVPDSIDRIGYLDFFAANPFSIISEDDKARADRLRLALAGFSEKQLSYGSVGERYVTRRKTLRNDLAVLTSLRLLDISGSGYSLTDQGAEVAQGLRSAYGDSLRVAARIVARRIGRASRKVLAEAAERALGNSWLLLDLFADVKDVDPTLKRDYLD